MSVFVEALKHPGRAFNHFFNPARNVELKKRDELVNWSKQGFPAPSPHFVKQATLLRNGLQDSVWVETGTYLGETTAVLSNVAKHVYTIEPEPTLFARAAKIFSENDKVSVLNGTSESEFPALLPKLQGDVCFWLDGHFSAGNTYQGDLDTPILVELKEIGKNLENWEQVVIAVDDMRLFGSDAPEDAGYPSKKAVVDWAEERGLRWHIEQDIFFAKNF